MQMYKMNVIAKCPVSCRGDFCWKFVSKAAHLVLKSFPNPQPYYLSMISYLYQKMVQNTFDIFLTFKIF